MSERLKPFLKRFHLPKQLGSWQRSQSTKRLGSYWADIIKRSHLSWASSKPRKEAPRILLATSLGFYQPATNLESLLAVALRLRGAEPHVLLCDSMLSACQLCDIFMYPDPGHFIRHGPKRDLCKNCFKPANTMFHQLGIKVHRYSEYLSQEDIESAHYLSSELDKEEIFDYEMDGIQVGEHARAGALRFFARGDLRGELYGERVLRSYFKSALITASMLANLLNRLQFDKAVFHHGIYVPQGIIGEVCRNAGIQVINWHPAYRKGCFIFSEKDTYHKTLLSEPASSWESIPWSYDLEKDLMDYLQSRWQGSRDWIHFNRNPEENLERISRKLGVDFSKPSIGMLTNVVWDAQLHYPTNTFHNTLDWVFQTIDYFSKRSDLQLLMRIHPAEITGVLPSRQKVFDEIKKAFPVLPDNVFIIPPESRISTYAVMRQCNAVIIYATKTGTELSCLGIPVIVAGEAFVRNKGITHDCQSPEEYFRLLERLPFPEPLDKERKGRARKYAYHFFFRRMIPLEFVEPIKPKFGGQFFFRLNIPDLEALLPGKSTGLDVICDGILRGGDFIYPVENIRRIPKAHGT